LGKGTIKNPHSLTSTNKIKAVPKIEITELGHPVFCFKYIHQDFTVQKCDNDKKVALIEQITTLSQLSWNDIQVSPRHGLGCEKLPLKSIKPKMPNFITEEVTYLLVFRYSGKLPFAGFRNRFIFHILFIENNFGDLYNH
jgi:hypothetical protein